MIRIKIYDLHLHRNETTFRFYKSCSELFRDAGIDIDYRGNSYDFAWIGQASYSNKTISLKESIERGLEYLDSIPGDYWLFDGQDSASLIGSYDVFLKSKAQYLLKNTMYSDSKEYSYPYTNGRNYWGMSLNGWKITDWSRFGDVKLSGTNWLSTVHPNWFQYKGAQKDIDVFAMFSFPCRENFEFTIKTSTDYDLHRSRCVTELQKLPRNIKIAMLENGQKVPLQEYYNLMSRSKIIVAPFGYGEMAPRDIESAMVGAILFKPNMDHLISAPNPYITGVSYVDLEWNFEDLQFKILNILNSWPSMQEYYVENMRSQYIERYEPKGLVHYIYNLIKSTPGVTNE